MVINGSPPSPSPPTCSSALTPAHRRDAQELGAGKGEAETPTPTLAGGDSCCPPLHTPPPPPIESRTPFGKRMRLMSPFGRVGGFKVNNFFVCLSYIKLQRSPPRSYLFC